MAISTAQRLWNRARHWPRWDTWLLASVTAAAGLLLLGCLAAVRFPPLRWLDNQTERLADQLVEPGLIADVLAGLSVLTDPWVLRVFGVVVLVVLYRRGEHRLAAWMFTAVMISWPLEQLAVLLSSSVAGFGTPPPFATGHALTSMIVIGSLSVLGMRQPGEPLRRFASWANGRLVLLLIALVQLGLGSQRVSGIAAGWLLGITVISVLALAFGLAQPVRRRHRDARRKRVAVVLNPTKVQSTPDFRRQLSRIATEFGWEPPLWFETTEHDAGRSMTRAGLESRVDLVIAAGGDGTVRVVCSELAGTGVPLGIVPAGTGNLLVRNLGLPLDPESAMRVALTGRDRELDLVRVSGDGLEEDRFAVMAGLGLDAAVVGDAPPKLKAQMGWPAYLVSIARHVSYPAVRVEVSVDGRRPERRWARMVLVGNVGSLHAGLQLLPSARPDDGYLDVVVVSPRRVTEWPALLWRIVRRSEHADDRLSQWRGRRVSVRTASTVPRQLDGDVVREGHELHCEVEPAVLLIRVPAGLG